MPLRDYECSKCHHTIEKYFHKESEIELPSSCPKCKKKPDWIRKFPKIGLGKVRGGTPKFHHGK